MNGALFEETQGFGTVVLVAVTSNTALAIVPCGGGPVSSTGAVPPDGTMTSPPAASAMIEPELL